MHFLNLRVADRRRSRGKTSGKTAISSHLLDTCSLPELDTFVGKATPSSKQKNRVLNDYIVGKKKMFNNYIKRILIIVVEIQV